MLRVLIVFSIMIGWSTVSAQDAVEAAASCVVIHETDDAVGENITTCFENISLERSSFESGVCQWKTDVQAEAQVPTITRFVPYCPASYTGYCDRLVLGPGVVAPVKIFLYDQSADVLERAREQCLSGGGEWTINDGEIE